MLLDSRALPQQGRKSPCEQESTKTVLFLRCLLAEFRQQVCEAINYMGCFPSLLASPRGLASYLCSLQQFVRLHMQADFMQHQSGFVVYLLMPLPPADSFAPMKEGASIVTANFRLLLTYKNKRILLMIEGDKGL